MVGFVLVGFLAAGVPCCWVLAGGVLAGGVLAGGSLLLPLGSSLLRWLARSATVRDTRIPSEQHLMFRDAQSGYRHVDICVWTRSVLPT